LTFKENVPDIRNSKVIDTYNELREFGIEPIVHDPRADPDTVRRAYGIELAPIDEFQDLGALIYAVAHDEFAPFHERICDMIADNGILVDVRSKIGAGKVRPDIVHWSL
jgi:UDP-N-acetyl-D-galactosamine dehydrogenase